MVRQASLNINLNNLGDTQKSSLTPNKKSLFSKEATLNLPEPITLSTQTSPMNSTPTTPEDGTNPNSLNIKINLEDIPEDDEKPRSPIKEFNKGKSMSERNNPEDGGPVNVNPVQKENQSIGERRQIKLKVKISSQQQNNSDYGVSEEQDSDFEYLLNLGNKADDKKEAMSTTLPRKFNFGDDSPFSAESTVGDSLTNSWGALMKSPALGMRTANTPTVFKKSSFYNQKASCSSPTASQTGEKINPLSLQKNHTDLATSHSQNDPGLSPHSHSSDGSQHSNSSNLNNDSSKTNNLNEFMIKNKIEKKKLIVQAYEIVMKKGKAMSGQPPYLKSKISTQLI